jgi:hypothetical protein
MRRYKWTKMQLKLALKGFSKRQNPDSECKKKSDIKLAAALILAAIPLSITQQPRSNLIPEPPIKQATAEAQAPKISPSVLVDTDTTLTITATEPCTVFFCGCAHSRTRGIDAFKAPHKPSDI